MLNNYVEAGELQINIIVFILFKRLINLMYIHQQM